jgi:type I restriction enzyme S subunit
MQELLTRGIGHTRFKKTEIGEIPEGWRVKRMGDIAEVQYGISEAVSQNKDSSLGWPILTGANITLDGNIDIENLVYIEEYKARTKRLQAGDLLFNWRSGSVKHVGKTALFDLPGSFTCASFILIARPNALPHPEFAHAQLNHMRDRGMFLGDVSQQVNFKLNATVFRDVLFPLPTIEEQKKIASILSGVDELIQSENTQLQELDTLKKGLMQDLLTGKVRVAV